MDSKTHGWGADVKKIQKFFVSHSKIARPKMYWQWMPVVEAWRQRLQNKGLK